MKYHSLPDESISMADSHRNVTRDGRAFKYFCHETFYFDHNGRREVIRCDYYQHMSCRIDKRMAFRLEITPLWDYDSERNRYNTRGETMYYEIAPKDGEGRLYHGRNSQGASGMARKVEKRSPDLTAGEFNRGE